MNNRQGTRRFVRRNGAADDGNPPTPRFAPIPGGLHPRPKVLSGVNEASIKNTGIAGGLKLPGAGPAKTAVAPIKPTPAGGGGGGGGGGPKPDDEGVAPETVVETETTWYQKLWAEHRIVVLLVAVLLVGGGYWAWRRYA